MLYLSETFPQPHLNPYLIIWKLRTDLWISYFVVVIDLSHFAQKVPFY